MALSRQQVEAYHRDGFIVVENVLATSEVAELRSATDAIVEKARSVSDHDDVYDLEPSHTPDDPRIRRIKKPHRLAPIFDRVMRHEGILAILRPLIGSAIRFDESKLNLKSPEYGSAVEWHQDWGFYPHTNDDLCAVGVMMDDCFLENGPLLCIRGSHKGPVYDHHVEGAFAGAIDASTPGLDFERAVPCTGTAGSISVHHVRMVHGSALNTSDRPRRLLLYQYAAADAWPLAAAGQPADWATWRDRVLCGEPDLIAPRMTAVPVRLPLPPPRRKGSIYETQRDIKSPYFAPPAPARATTS